MGFFNGLLGVGDRWGEAFSLRLPCHLLVQ